MSPVLVIARDDDRTINDSLASARTRNHNRYAPYDMTAAAARLRGRRAACHRAATPAHRRDSPAAHTEWTTREDERTLDADHAWSDLTPSAC
ncbi:hypothetical protein ACF1BE_28750 [Streptomyces sp. NPDC014991]|uniref:hypothetical protein n=1 Tax=Streptomyces sp. NPDC014991 TaxID=3364935 RepID=UPI0036F72A6C